MINEFIQQFTEKKIENITKINNRHYLAEEELLSLKDKIRLNPESIGLFLGEETRNGFRPSLALLEELAKISDRKVFLNKKAELLFICGRDIFGKSTMQTHLKKGLVLVQNERDENLGYGRFADQGKLIKNIMDKGDYLRREMRKPDKTTRNNRREYKRQ